MHAITILLQTHEKDQSMPSLPIYQLQEFDIRADIGWHSDVLAAITVFTGIDVDAHPSCKKLILNELSNLIVFRSEFKAQIPDPWNINSTDMTNLMMGIMQRMVDGDKDFGHSFSGCFNLNGIPMFANIRSIIYENIRHYSTRRCSF